MRNQSNQICKIKHLHFLFVIHYVMDYSYELANYVSMSLAVVVVLPWILFVATLDPWFVYLGLSIIAVELSTKIIKIIVGTSSIYGRPAEARDCDITCSNGYQGGMYGFPSGHVAVASCVSVALMMKYPSLGSIFVATFFVIVMAWSRLHKRCHNMIQVITGCLYGSLCGVGVASLGMWET